MAGGLQFALASCVATTDAILRALRTVQSPAELAALMAAITAELGFRHYALIHHADLRASPSGRVDIKDYPTAVTARIIGEGQYRRDPVIRACAFAEGRSEEHTSELQSLMRISYAVFCLKKTTNKQKHIYELHQHNNHT